MTVTILTATLLLAIILTIQKFSECANAQNATQQLNVNNNGFCLAANTFTTQLKNKEKLSVLTAFGYCGNNDEIYFDTGDTSIDIGVSLYDSKNNYIPVSGKVRKPLPPPGSWFIKKDGKEIFVVPVHKINKSEVKALIIKDILKPYTGLKSGNYQIRTSLKLGIYKKNNIIERTDVKHKYWAIPTTAIKRLELKSNPITITILAEKK